MLEVLLFETPKMLEFQIFLIHPAECSSVHGNVIRVIRAEGVHLRHFRMVTLLENDLFGIKMI
jgi:hypothetical protein